MLYEMISIFHEVLNFNWLFLKLNQLIYNNADYGI